MPALLHFPPEAERCHLAQVWTFSLLKIQVEGEGYRKVTTARKALNKSSLIDCNFYYWVASVAAKVPGLTMLCTQCLCPWCLCEGSALGYNIAYLTFGQIGWLAQKLLPTAPLSTTPRLPPDCLLLLLSGYLPA